MFDRIISVYAPYTCLGCLAEGELLCGRCQGEMPLAAARCCRCRALSPDGRTCKSCQHSASLYAVHTRAVYESVAKEIVARLKFAGAQSAAETIADTLLALPLPKDAIIVPVPTATSRVRLRGYDQAVLIAKALAHKSGVPYLPCLLRQGQHRQVGASRLERLQHMQTSFIVRNARMVAGRHIVLVDDVMTTGATLESATAALKAAGAKRIEAVVFARA